MNDRNWLHIIERDGAANLGQTLLRLAQLAASAHQFEAAQLTAPLAGQGGATDGVTPRASTVPAVRTEVDR